MKKIENAGVEIAPVSRHFLNEEGADKTPFDSQLIFGYGNTPPEAIEEGVRRLRAALKNSDPPLDGCYKV
jgi:DNA-binding transcriptional MocR family regulator